MFFLFAYSKNHRINETTFKNIDYDRKNHRKRLFVLVFNNNSFTNCFNTFKAESKKEP